jgi:carbonic anhydrase
VNAAAHQTGRSTEGRPGSPAEAWTELAAGNRRFVEGRHLHPNQDAQTRNELAGGQQPFALIFGCADSRVAAEIIFDQGLGDLFIVRTAGHVVDAGVLGSIEYGVQVLGIPLVGILGHDSCGAVAATVAALDTGTMPGGYLRDLVERVTPSVLAARQAGRDRTDDIEAEHVRQTGLLLLERSLAVADAVAAGRCAIVGLIYDLADGEARIVGVSGEIGVAAAP